MLHPLMLGMLCHTIKSMESWRLLRTCLHSLLSICIKRLTCQILQCYWHSDKMP